MAFAGCAEGAPARFRGVTVGSTSAGASYACALTEAGEVYCWDARLDPQVYGAVVPRGHAAGAALRVQELPPVALVRASKGRTWASTRDAGVFWWGARPYGSNDAGCDAFCAPRQLEGIGSVSALASSGETACGLVGSDVWCWGSNAHAELGVVPAEPDPFRWLPPRRVLGGARDVTMSFSRVYATLLDSSVVSWGDGSPTVTALPVSDVSHFANGCALTRRGTLWCQEQSANPRHGVAVLGVREGAFMAGNCIGHTDGTVVCWDYDDTDGGRRIGGVEHPLALAVAPLPRGTRLPGEENACAVVAGDEVCCWSVDGPDAGVRIVTGLP